MKRIISILLLTSLILCSVSCSGGNYALKYGSTTVSENEYLYWLSSYKALFLKYYLNNSDTDEAWNMQISDNGVTIAELLEGVALDNIKNNTVCLELFKKSGLKLTKDQENSVDEYINSLVEAAGSRSALDNALSAFGVSTSSLKSIYLDEERIKALKTSLFEPGGELEVTESEKDDFYNKSYVRVKHIYINNVKDYARDADGDLIIDSSTGTYKTRDLSDDEKSKKDALAQTIYNDILSGADFDALMAANSADTNMKLYPDGYYITSSSTRLPSELIKKAFSMSDGECAYIESEIGIHILKRESLKDKAYEDENYSTFFSDFENTIQTNKLSEYLQKLTPDVEVNTEITGSFSIRTCTANYSY